MTVAITLDGETLEVGARVMRSDSNGCAVSFGALAPAVENRISRYLTDQQRRRGRPRT